MQAFDTVDVLRLEVEDDPTGLVNLIQNPNGDLGGWGWITPLASSSLIRSSSPQALYYERTAAGASYFYTEPMPVAAGQYVAASYSTIATGPAHYQRARFEYLDASLVVLGSSSQTALSGVSGTFNLGPFAAPPSTAYVRLRVDVYTSGGANPTGTNFVYLYNVTAAKAATSGTLGSARANLIPNPSFETNTNGWAVRSGCTIARSTAQAAVGSASLAFTSVGFGTPGVTTPVGTAGIPITPGQTYTAQVKTRAATTPRDIRVGLFFYDNTGATVGGSYSPLGAPNATGGWTTHTHTLAAPASAAYAAVIVLTNAVGVTGEVHYLDAVMLEQATAAGSYFDAATPDAGGWDYAAATRPPVVTTRTNLIPNPSFETDAAGWSASPGSVARSTAQAAVGSAALRLTCIAGDTYAATSTNLPVVAGKRYQLQFRTRAATTARTIEAYLSFRTSADVLISPTPTKAVGANTSSGWTTHVAEFDAPAGAAFARVGIGVLAGANGEQHYIDAVLLEAADVAGDYFDGATPDGTVEFAAYDRAWTGTAHASSSTETKTITLPYSTATSSNLAFIEPVPYLNVLGPTHEIRVVREALNVGTLEATILDAALDPAQSDLIRPGRRVRLLALDTVTSTWLPMFTGKMGEASVTYPKDLSLPDQKRARIQITAADGLAELANQKRAEGVATIDELPYVLEGAGAPWNANGSGDQVPTAAVVAYNDNASAVDQIAITRDSSLGYAWMDRYGVVQMWDPTAITAVTSAGFDESVVTDYDVSFNTQDCINEVTIRFLRLNPDTGETEEIPYGPYRNETSIAEWGVRSAEFTVQGLSEETTEIPDLAAAILAANSDPVVRINGITMIVSDESHLTTGYALADVMALALVEKTLTAPVFADDSFIQRIEHTITPDKWTLAVGFLHEDVVASPQFTPSPATGAGGKTIGQLLRPVGEVTMWYGSTAQIPAGWLRCDGAAIPADYPELIALIGANTPNMVDVFPIGAGTKAKGTTGGNPTKTISENNLPLHKHPLSRSAGTGATGNIPRGGAADGTTTNSENNVTTATPLDVMPPWRALHFIIRAR